MKHLIGITLSLLFLTSCGEAPKEKVKKTPVVETQVLELSYLRDVTVSDILKVIKKHQLTAYEKSTPRKIKVSENLIMDQRYFTDFYRKRNKGYESEIHMSGLSNNLGSVSVVVRNLQHKSNKNKMTKMFNNLVSSLPKKLFPATINGPNWIDSFSKNLKPTKMKGIFTEVSNGIEYTFMLSDIDIWLDICKEGN